MGYELQTLEINGHTKTKKMGLSDCIECWQTPCECGYEYSCWSIQRKVEQIKTIMGKDEKAILEKLNQKEETPLCTPDNCRHGY
jgi:hypothetical protein